MRLIRGNSSNKENFNTPVDSGNRSKMEELQLELKSAYAQVNALKSNNRELLWKVERCDKQMQRYRRVQQELQFLKEQELNSRQQLTNYEQLNRKLREQLDSTQKENITLKEHISRNEQYKLNESSAIHQSFRHTERNSLTTRSSQPPSRLHLSNEKPKGNHCSTPKSKMKINWEDLLPGHVQEHKKEGQQQDRQLGESQQ